MANKASKQITIDLREQLNVLKDIKSVLDRQNEAKEKMIAQQKKADEDAKTERAKKLIEEKNEKERLSRLQKFHKDTSTAINTIKSGLRDVNNLSETLFGLSFNIKNQFMDIAKSIGQTLQVAPTYALGTSLISNRAAREQALRYGLGYGQNYALTQTMGLMGMQGEEDLMFMNQNQRALFTTMMQKYTSWYDKMEQSGTLASIQSMQMDLKIFKEQLAMDFMQWFSDNKETMLSALITSANALKMIMQTIAGAINVFGGRVGGTTSLASDTINNMNMSRSVNVYVTQSNNISATTGDIGRSIESELSSAGIKNIFNQLASGR